MSTGSVVVGKLKEKLLSLSTEAKELYLDSSIPIIDKPPNPLDFYRSFVAANRPVVVRNGLRHWPALSKWNASYFREKIGDLEVTATVTPNGYADAVTDGKFVMPEERKMTMAQFLDIMEEPASANGVYYIQKQNSNMTDEFASLLEDVGCGIPPGIPWGTEAFGKNPDAVNFWMGDERAVTSTHRDHYENLYCVVRGWKRFILIPPTDLPFVSYETYLAATFRENKNGNFDIIDDHDTGKVPWIAIDPLRPDLEKYPQYTRANPVSVTVHEGEILYLPSLWFHHVQQSHGCIAVNYWYDMEYDIKYNYYKFVESVVSLAR